MPKRNFNYTKRIDLKLKHTSIRLVTHSPNEARSFDADLNLPEGLPSEAHVFVEAYRSSPAARMRFDWGTVGELAPAKDRRLTDFFGDPRPPLFRVKVTDVSERPGLLLADASRIRPHDPDETPQNKRGILHTYWGDNNGLVWCLDLNNPLGPCLILDESVDLQHEMPQQLLFQSLVYPEIVRRVFTHILFVERETAEDPESWQAQWLTFPKLNYGFDEEPPPLDSATTTQDYDDDGWIDRAVEHFARHAKFCKHLTPALEDDQ